MSLLHPWNNLKYSVPHSDVITPSFYLHNIPTQNVYKESPFSPKNKKLSTVSNKTVAMFVWIWLFWLYHCRDFSYKNVNKSNIVALNPGYNSHTIMKVWNSFPKKIWTIYDRVCIATVLLLIFLNRKILSIDISCDIYYVLSYHVTCERVNMI